MASHGYESDMAYLRGLADNGTLTRNNAIFQKLDGKRNVPEVRAFMKDMDAKAK